MYPFLLSFDEVCYSSFLSFKRVCYFFLLSFSLLTIICYPFLLFFDEGMYSNEPRCFSKVCISSSISSYLLRRFLFVFFDEGLCFFLLSFEKIRGFVIPSLYLLKRYEGLLLPLLIFLSFEKIRGFVSFPLIF